MALSFLIATITQGSADAFKETEIPTGLTLQGTTAWRLRELWVELGAAAGAANAGAIANAGYDLSLTRVTQAASVLISARSLVWKRKWFNNLITSGAYPFEQVWLTQWGEEDAPVIVEEALFGQIDSNGSSAANVCTLKLGVEAVRVTDAQRLQIQVNSLTS